MNCVEWCYPKILKKGMTIAFLVPDSMGKEEMDEVKYLWESTGYKVLFGESSDAKKGYEGSSEKEVVEFNYYMTEGPCDAVIVMSTCYGSMGSLDKVDYRGIRKYRKPFIGDSNCTALHLAIERHSKLVTYHGPVAVDQLKNQSLDFQHLLDLLEGRTRAIEPLPGPPRGAIGSDCGYGILKGGNLTLISLLMGTHYGLEIENLENTILFIEAEGETPDKIDGMLQQLRLSGILRLIKGMAIGNFKYCQECVEDEAFDIGYYALRYMEEGRKPDENQPFVFYLPTGPGKPHWAIPLGAFVSFRPIANTMLCLPYCDKKI